MIAQAYWGQKALQRVFTRYVVGVKLRHPLQRVYWFLITKGYKTYLLLSRYFPEYWPRPGVHRFGIQDFTQRQCAGGAYRPENGQWHTHL